MTKNAKKYNPFYDSKQFNENVIFCNENMKNLRIKKKLKKCQTFCENVKM